MRESILLNALASVGAALVVVLLSWVAWSQTQLLSTVAVVIANQDNQQASQAREVNALREAYGEHEGLFRRIWPRLRALDSNDTLLAEEIEDLHDGTEVKLVEPQEF